LLQGLVSLGDFDTIVIPSGESNKTIATCELVWNRLTALNTDRKALVLNLGGGVVTDLGGFAVSCYKRGIDFINIPTTLLAMVDASTGGKTGVDFGVLKNHIGLFSEPIFTWVNSKFLQTLPEREYRSGASEMLKHGIIDSKAHFDAVSSNMKNLSRLIPDSVAIKQRIVAQDPTEKGLRKILNFGHTLGHAIESYYLHTNTQLVHGEAIAIGMQMEAYLSTIFCGLEETTCKLIIETFRNHYPNVTLDPATFEGIIDLMLQDKKNERGCIRFVGIKDFGEPIYDIEIDTSAIVNAFEYYNGLNRTTYL
jgi:3-dehydroquinate synthase